MPKYDEEVQWVHEADYGEPAFGGVLLGLFGIVVGLTQMIVEAIQKRRRR